MNEAPSLRSRFIGVFAYGLVRTLGALQTTTIVGLAKSETDPISIYCGWHGRSLLFANYFRRKSIGVIISNSNDGDIQAAIFRRLRYKVIRGSSGRGGERALVEAIRALKAGHSLAMTPDGPRGPSHELQPGVVMMARKTGAALVPVGISCSRRKLMRSWDRYMLPLPFGKARLIFGEPIHVAPNATDAEMESARLQLQSEINRLETEAERVCGHGAT